MMENNINTLRNYKNLVNTVSIKIRRFLDAIKGEPHIPDEVVINTARMFEVEEHGQEI